MTTKSLKKFTELLNRREGISIVPIIVVMVLMSVMGAVFTSIMGEWKVSAPMTINSKKAYYLAETAAMFALQDAKYRFFSKDASGCPDFPACGYGTRLNTFEVVRDPIVNPTEIAEFWIERPYLPGSPPYSTNSTVDLNRGNNDDIITGADDNEDDEDDDDDDATVNLTTDVNSDGFSDVYTIIATGKVLRGGTTVAKRQIKIKATITDNSSAPILPGVHTEGQIEGTGPPNNAHFDIRNPAPDPDVWVTYGNGLSLPLPPTGGSLPLEEGIIYRTPPQLDANVFKALAQDQGHYFPGNLSPANNYPNGNYYFDTPTDTMPNVIFVEGNFTINGNLTIYGVYWIKGSTTVFNGNYQINGIIISEGDITMNGGGSQTPNLNGGIIQYGVGSSLTGNGNPVDIDINVMFFNALNATIPIITVKSWQEAVSAN